MLGSLYRAVSLVGSTLKTSLTPVFSGIISREMANQRHKKVIKLAKGYRNRRNRCFSMARRAVDRARRFSFIGRKVYTLCKEILFNFKFAVPGAEAGVSQVMDIAC